MKTIVILLLCMIVSFAVVGQTENADELKYAREEAEVEVNAPRFTGIEDYMSVAKDANYASIKMYLKDRIIVPNESVHRFDQGTEVIHFTVTAEGLLTDFKVVNSVSKELDEEMIRVLKTTEGMWQPGLNEKIPTDMPKEVSLAFRNDLSNKSFLEMAEIDFKKGSKKLLIDKKPKRALKKFDHAVMLLPYDQSALFMRGLCRYECGDMEGANEDWKRLNVISGGEFDLTLIPGSAKIKEAYAHVIEAFENN